MARLGSGERPLRVAVVGSGPSGFYAADALFKAGPRVTVGMFERLPTPYGLVRAGVAPDHPKIKSITRVFDRIAAESRFAFWGNVTVGRDVSVDELRRYYDAVIFAYGAEKDRRLGIPGEDLPGSHTATDFVGWYNGHPDLRDRVFDLSHETAVVIGQGNVALDVCRILAKPAAALSHTDIAQHALVALARSRVRQIYVIGRRGPAQAKFASTELKELADLAECELVVERQELGLDAASRAEAAHPNNIHARNNLALLEKIASRTPSAKSRRVVIRFLLTPVAVRGGAHVEAVRFERNELADQPFQLRAVRTGVEEEIPCGLLLRSVGYQGVPMPGVPFDSDQGVIPTRAGRVVDADVPVPGLYAAGWIKRGPRGVIGANKPDSAETVKSLLEDLSGLAPCLEPDDAPLHTVLKGRGVRVVDYEGWKRIDAAETARGHAVGKPREKFTCIPDMLEIVESSSGS